MAIFVKPKAKMISVGQAKIKSAANTKAKAVKPGKSGGSVESRMGLPKGSTYLYKNEPKQKVD